MDWVTSTIFIGLVGIVTFGLLYLLLAERFLRTRERGIRTARGMDVHSSSVTAEVRASPGEMKIASKEHLQTLSAAIGSMSMASWNQWRKENPDIIPSLSGVELLDINLSFANLSRADLSHADFSGAILHNANLQYANLSSTNLQKADLSGADLSYSILKDADLRKAILRDAKLRGTNLIGADLKDADFNGVDLTDALIDSEAINQDKKRFGGGISRLEKFALGLFAHAKGKNRPSPDAGTEPPRSDKHI